MTNREKEILELIKENPFITQDELAKQLNIARSSVAVHIANLIKKGYILGRGYIINKLDYVTVIGGANIDINGFPNKKLKLKDSNPGKLKISPGGVGRNIAENLSRLNINTKLLTAIGNDIYGKKIIEHSKNIGIDISDSLILSDFSTSTYLAILDEKGDMAVGLSDMEICEKIDINYIKSKKNIIEKSKAVILDTNLPQKTIEYITKNINNTFIVDTVSTAKTVKILNILNYVHSIKPNIYEAEILSGIKIENKKDAEKAVRNIINKGVKRVFLTMGKDGILCADKNKTIYIKTPKIKVINATGAGDAFTAGIVLGYLNNYSLEKTAKISIAASAITLESEGANSEQLSKENIENKLKEMKL
ncbi:sugar kinase, ribokinase [Marinitoga piezophila KA3]|uniref:Sugar kinase, ribokinase n=1 Tax=Marinitoga piezophila (strain DSM 14283 / JCM 11233 / KA3) TaxID=443254 RepID=H2J7F3_MARPK|nr:MULTISPECIES: PfkB family carbohydrate kinase [Marinitoga]AEX86446.1 sugar kinase, ribokinase [Marinitoga piezophila KA3]APT76834.1 kinase [Marinitoga sp. 1137]